MPSRPRHARSGASRVGDLAAAVLTRDVPGLTPAERDAAVAHVERSLASMPDWTRAGVGVASLVAATVTRTTRTSGAWVPDPRLPVLGELTRLCRTLGLMGLAEHRAGDVATGPVAR